MSSILELRTDRYTRLAALAGALALVACGADIAERTGGAAEADTGEYVVERSAADGVETVRSVSGSRWGGAPELVQELSIGEELGADAYLFGSIGAAWATADRIYVVDSQVPAVRAFDHQGDFLHQLGGVGQGPGEYSRPIGIGVDGGGRILISDLQGARMNVFDAEGAPLDDWSLGSPMAALGLQVMSGGEIFTRVAEMPEDGDGGMVRLTEGMQAIGPDGRTGDPVYPPETDYEPPTVSIEAGSSSFEMSILPFTPQFQWALAPGGEMIAGVGNEYRFEIHRPDGGVTAVEKAWNPVPVNPDERGFRAEIAASNVRRMDPDFVIPASDVPDTKPAFTRLIPDRSGRVWVTRQGPSRPDPDCRETGGGPGMAIMIRGSGETRVSSTGGDEAEADECWMNTHMFDVFDLASGEFLGTVPAPEPGFRQPIFAADDVVLAAVTDELGTVRLKKYRLVVE